MALDTHVMGTTEDPEPLIDEPEPLIDESSLVDDPGFMWLSLGLVEMSNPDSEGGGGLSSQRHMALGLLPLYASSDTDSGESKPQGRLTESESRLSTDVSDTSKRRRVNPPSRVG